MELKLATCTLPLLIYTELELVLLLLNELLGYLLLLLDGGSKLLMLLPASIVMGGTVSIQPHEAFVDKLLNLAFKVDLLLESLL